MRIRRPRAPALNAPLDALRAGQAGWTPIGGPPPAPGLRFHADPAAGLTGRWQSPRGRLLELETEIAGNGDWFGLHLILPLPDLTGLPWLGFVARSAAGRAVLARACLRSGLPEGGFRDCFFDRHLLSQPAESDHVDLICPDRRPDLPLRAPWREFILFLPPNMGISWALHDLRLFLP